MIHPPAIARPRRAPFRAIALTAILAWFGAPAWAQPNPVVPKPFSATYEVSYRGIRAGSLTFTLSSDPSTGRYVYETRAQPSLLARLIVSSGAFERSVMQIDAQGVRPLEWVLEDGKAGDDKDGALQFDWQAGAVRGRVEGIAVELPAEPGIQDRLSIQIAVMTALLRQEHPGTISLIDDERVKRYTYLEKQEETLPSELGALQTVLYESAREGSDRLSRFWFVPGKQFITARAEQLRKGKVETVMILTALELPES